MKNEAWAVAAALACAAISGPVGAQTMYKCGKQYQDRPCDAGQQGRAVGSATSAPPAAGAASDAECTQRGSDALKVAWSREGGATSERLLAEIDAKGISSSKKAEERALVQSVYQKRGSAPQIRAAVEAECLAEKEKAAQAAALAAAAAKLQPAAPAPAPTQAAPAAAPRAPQASAVQQAGSADTNRTLCRNLGSSLESNRASQRKGGSTAAMEKLRESARSIEAQMRQAGC
jgi:hypothetical protein